jgi:hypothetical protein
MGGIARALVEKGLRMRAPKSPQLGCRNRANPMCAAALSNASRALPAVHVAAVGRSHPGCTSRRATPPATQGRRLHRHPAPPPAARSPACAASRTARRLCGAVEECVRGRAVEVRTATGGRARAQLRHGPARLWAQLPAAGVGAVPRSPVVHAVRISVVSCRTRWRLRSGRATVCKPGCATACAARQRRRRRRLAPQDQRVRAWPYLVTSARIPAAESPPRPGEGV